MKRLVSVFACVLFLSATASAQAPVPAPKPSQERCIDRERVAAILAQFDLVRMDLSGDEQQDYIAHIAAGSRTSLSADEVWVYVARAPVAWGEFVLPPGGALVAMFKGERAKDSLLVPPDIHAKAVDALGDRV